MSAIRLLLICITCALPFCAQAEPAHAIAMHGAPALPPDFDHLPYVNPTAPKGGRLSLGFLGTFDSLNPFNLKAGSTAQGLNVNVFQTLMARSLDEPFSLYGLVAQSIETDEARSFVTFHLNPKARFSDGLPITSEDVAFSFNLLKSMGRPQQRYAYGLVKAMTTPDAQTVHFDLAGIGDRELPLTLALMPVLSHGTTDKEHFNDTTLVPPLGSGPYRITEVKPGTKVVLTRNEEYWGANLPIQRGLFNFDVIELNYFRDANALFEAFQSGLLDYREENNPTRWIGGYDLPAIREGRQVRESLPVGGPKGMEGMAFNTRRSVFADVRVREALAEMFDFEWINVHVFGGLYSRTSSFFAESDLASTGRAAGPAERALLAPYSSSVREEMMDGSWMPARTDGSGRDRQHAKRALNLLEQAGYVVANGVLTRNGEPLEFEMMVQDVNQERLALNYAESLKRIGAIMKVRRADEVQYQRRRQKFDFDMMFGSWFASASPGNEQRSRWGSTSADQEASFNLAGAKSPAIDSLINDILAARSREDFIDAVRAYDRVLLSGFYIIPLFHRSQFWIASSSEIAHPDRLPTYASPLFGPSGTLDMWWRKRP